jgi:glycosyltransferase involved in cell wall biosynthesis
VRISIVTPTLNRAQYLGEAIESVLAQGHDHVEHIVVDGMSTDGTEALLARYPQLRVIREPDTGLYDALNKGLRAATGEIIGHLNSDDLYPAGTFAEVMAAFADSSVEAVYGGAEIFQGEGKVVQSFTSAAEKALSFENVTVGAPITNARFYRRSVYERVGYCDLGYRAAADRDFLFRVALANPKAALLDRIVYRYRWHDDSLTFMDDPIREAKWREEYLRIAEHYLVQADLPEAARECCRRWHRRESAQAATQALLAGRFRQWSACAARGWRWNRSWPFTFARHLGGALAGR